MKKMKIVSKDYIKSLIDKEKTVSNDEWNETLLDAASKTGLSVETILELIEQYESNDYYGNDFIFDEKYEQFLVDKYEAEKEMLDNAEDLTYGCDPYANY